jgi:monofunctional biosynthetic peptidoglycan transglycosylase
VKKNKPRRFAIARFLWYVLLLVAALHISWAAELFLLRYVNPITTGVQMQRRVESWLSQDKVQRSKSSTARYQKRYTFVPLAQISPHLQHAVIAAEDSRFYQHHGIDWDELGKVVQETNESSEPPRGASTITQQLVKNLFFTTHRNPVRKAFEFTLAPIADWILGKRRTLELYLNVVEWGPGIFGAEEAARYHYHTTAARLDRDQAARLAACLPAPRRRRPSFMNEYSAIIEARMEKAGW